MESYVCPYGKVFPELTVKQKINRFLNISTEIDTIAIITNEKLKNIIKNFTIKIDQSKKQVINDKLNMVINIDFIKQKSLIKFTLKDLQNSNQYFQSKITLINKNQICDGILNIQNNYHRKQDIIVIPTTNILTGQLDSMKVCNKSQNIKQDIKIKQKKAGCGCSRKGK